MNNYCVYKHIFPNNKIYIGITCRKPEYRWNEGKGYYQKNQSKMYNAIQKYGWENIKHEILFENLSKEEAEQKEIELIEKCKSYDDKFGYNITKGGNCIGNMTEETKRKISEANKGRKSWNKGLNVGVGKENNFYGHHHSEETKRKISEANKGRKKTPEQLKKVSESCKRTWKEKIENGYVMTEETKRKISEANKGKKSFFKGKHHTQEAKEKIRKAHLGKKNSDVIKKLAELNKKKIICIDNKMNFIKKYESIKEASVDMNISTSNIHYSLKNNKFVFKKQYRFIYEENYEQNTK